MFTKSMVWTELSCLNVYAHNINKEESHNIEFNIMKKKRKNFMILESNKDDSTPNSRERQKWENLK